MHMKFILLFYEKRLRVVLPTANFVDYDWRDIENVSFKRTACVVFVR